MTDLEEVERSWGTIEIARSWANDIWPEAKDDEEQLAEFATFQRFGGGPGDAIALYEADLATDCREVLPAIRVPALVIQRIDDPVQPEEEGRYIADHIHGARLVELPGRRFWWKDDLAATIEAFIAQLRQEEQEFDRVLATILFTDIVGATERAAGIGDRGWRELVEQHHSLVRGALARFRGTEIDTAGDGFFATFDGPARTVRCAQAIGEAIRTLGIEIRAGVHTGEVETMNEKVGGMAVNIEYAGEHELKGVPDRWRLYRVVG